MLSFCLCNKYCAIIIIIPIIMGVLSYIVLLSLHKCDQITCIYWCLTKVCLCRHLEIPSAPTTSRVYLARINFMFRGLNLRCSTTIPGAPHVSTYIAECTQRYCIQLVIIIFRSLRIPWLLKFLFLQNFSYSKYFS